MEVIHRDSMPGRYRKTLSIHLNLLTGCVETTVKEKRVGNSVLLQAIHMLIILPQIRHCASIALHLLSFCISMK